MAETSSYVRTQMLPPAHPPASQSGAVKWLRENLFSGPLNTILTLLGLLAVWYLVASALPWWLNSVWNAESLGQCREIVAASAGEGATGACWAMIRERWHQFIFGFYPPSEWWRPVLAFGLLFAALAPVLYAGQRRSITVILAVVLAYLAVTLWLAAAPGLAYALSIVLVLALIGIAWVRPGWLLWFTGLFAIIVFWLLWGGTVWGYVSLLVAVGLGGAVALAYGRFQGDTPNLCFAALVAAGAALLAGVLADFIGTVSTGIWGSLQSAEFYRGFLADRGGVLAALGAVLSAIVWVLSWIAWALIALVRGVSWVLNLDPTPLTGSGLASHASVAAVLGAVGAFLAARSRLAMMGIFAGLVALGGYWVFAHTPAVDWVTGLAPLALTPVETDEFGGFLLAIIIGVTAIGCSLPLGIVLALGRQSDMLIVKTLSVGFIEFIRGVPLITLLFTASLLLQYFLPPNTNFDIILRVIILVTLFAAAYIAEVIRGGLAALPRGQYEAADALGLDYWRAQRLIILPQALKISIPGIVSSFIGLFKDTTLVAFVGLMDPLKGVTQIVRADIDWKGIYWEPYIFVGVIFFVICFGMSRYSMYLERKLKTDHR
jgi:His/Glu/Gln/Arg/opine family amino acid ABC transporter permease subunit